MWPLFSLLFACSPSPSDDGGTSVDGPTDPTETGDTGATGGTLTDTDTDTDTGTATDTGAGGALADCSPWVGWAPGRTWTYETTNSEGTYTWTQTLEVDDDGIHLISVLPDTTATATYRCVDGDVELLTTEATVGPGVATETYDPPFLVWSGDEPVVGASWTSTSTVEVTAGPINQTQQKTSTWTVTEAGPIEADGTTWPDAVRFTVSASTTQGGNVTVANEDTSVTTLDGPGIVSTESETTTMGGVATSTTRFVSFEDR